MNMEVGLETPGTFAGENCASVEFPVIMETESTDTRLENVEATKENLFGRRQQEMATVPLPRSKSASFATPTTGRTMFLRSRQAQYNTLALGMTPEIKRRTRFRFGRKRRRKTSNESEAVELSGQIADTDTLSMSSTFSSVSTMSTLSTMTACGVGRKRRALERITTAVSQSPKLQSIKRSVNLQGHLDIVMSPCKQPKIPIKEYHSPKMQASRPRHQQLWIHTVDRPIDSINKELMKRQEAIYEICVHAQTMRSDVKTVVDNYIGPMQQFGYLNEEEGRTLFGDISSFADIHDEVASKILLLRSIDDGTVDCIGNTFLLCVPRLRGLIPFCSRLHLAKALYNKKIEEPSVRDFLDRCQKSSFSSKRSLWDFLDSQRSGLLKYPLLLKVVLKTTPDDHPDVSGLCSALSEMEKVISDMDARTGEVLCKDLLRQLEYTSDVRCPVVDSSRAVLCSGNLKLAFSSRQRVHAILFDQALVVARPTTHGGELVYQVSYQPIYTSHMSVESINDGEMSVAGSFRNALNRRSSIISGNGLSNVFRVTRTQNSREPLVGKQTSSFTFVANDVHDKKAWVDAFESAVTNAPPVSTTV